MVLVYGPCSVCSRSDSGVRRKGREREKNEEEKWERDLLTPTPPPLSFSAHISLRCPHDLNAWNRLPSCVQRFQYAPWLACKKTAIVDLP